MPDSLRQLNPTILKERLPANYEEVLNQAETNVNRAVNEIIGQYEERLEQLAKQLEDGQFSEKLQEEYDRMDTEWQDQIASVEQSYKTIKMNAEALKRSASNASEGLKKLAEELVAESDKLQSRLTDIRTKVRKVGDLSGKTLGTALRKFVSG